jgi:hypothetical protein
MNFLQTAYKLLMNFLQTPYKLLMNYLQTAYKLRAAFLQTSKQAHNELLKNFPLSFLKTFYERHTNFLYIT